MMVQRHNSVPLPFPCLLKLNSDRGKNLSSQSRRFAKVQFAARESPDLTLSLTSALTPRLPISCPSNISKPASHSFSACGAFSQRSPFFFFSLPFSSFSFLFSFHCSFLFFVPCSASITRNSTSVSFFILFLSLSVRSLSKPLN